ncbi:glycosyltransferase family 9 protein [Streptomyces sp. NPDC047028]|uniref:glycosyltransferase family 9 protein n=1 Tax=Streptomyces sp. NPDC047028 TaxID=3155793 RepID=UPI0033D0B76F
MKALVVRLDSFGDVLLAGPAVRAVAAGCSHLTMLCGPRGADAARMLPTAPLLRLAGVGRIGADSVDHPGRLLDERHRRLPDRHEAQAALDTATALGFPPTAGDDGPLHVVPPPDTGALTGHGPYAVLHPGASAPARAWSPDRCAEAVALLADAGHRVVVTGGPGERALTRRVAGDLAVDLGGRTTARTLAGVLRMADAVVSANTGPAHLAAAVGTPVVSLFAPVVPAGRWAPYGVPVILLGDPSAPCADTRALVWPVPGHPCQDEVTGQDVVRAVHKLMQEGSS